MQSTSSRKGRTSITHLMNFTLPPRPQSHYYGHNTHRNQWRSNRAGFGYGTHAQDKAKYIHANYRFVVKPGNYHKQSEDPDVHLEWEDVLQVLASEHTQSTSCPICLSTPVAPRITKCGHIFCLPCLIRYMYASDDAAHIPEKKSKYKKCPLCEDIIYVPESRPVRWVAGKDDDVLREGDDVVLRLMMRQPRSILALPRDIAEAIDHSESVPWYFAAEVFDYARIMKGSEEYMFEQYDKEIADVELQEKEDEVMFMEETTRWSRKAVSVIQESKERVRGIGSAPPIPNRPPTPIDRKAKRRAALESLESAIENQSMASVSGSGNQNIHTSTPDFYMIQHAAKRGASEFTPAHKEEAESQGQEDLAESDALLPPTRPVAIPPAHQNRSNDSPFYFYEAAHRFYLSPLDIRILKVAFGDFSLFPTTTLPCIEHVSSGHVVDDDLKRRIKYLAHLPNGCDVGFIECDWTDVVSPEVLSGFSAEISRRRQSHMEKQAREDKEDRIRAGKTEEEKRWAAARRRQNVERALRDEEFEPLPMLEEGLPSSSPPWPSSRQPNQGSVFETLASPSTSPATAKTVWGTAKIPPLSPPLVAELEPEPASQDDGWLQWDMSAQLQATSLGENGNGGGKKKKNKKITLMTTNGFRGA